ncbi:MULTISPECIES: hybrid sensor histidine kinase/response regulator [Dyadobacter]|jgi:two-component system sensor histidine kinase/response regulator|uniref:histidine kinase n=1 Tax=Dyadobacter chenhuakuii TaxID=2909339 RepID=A0ABY4XMY6_9BACT|nr:MULTISPECIES: hybrid sensor histidine kinase/response regulator [Dyadobacter]MCF2494891.1 hybrid sensor histidine kinase/response regulator [Dyadobacter chenhuakuii]MCF2519028.1 hybrid sensor histidine kinase/response regulator [Dyadobacter sp. CY351]USJ31792.1 hybrid sensor histidine kinase/response regulator [Dyadobacter chenhuakuii]
MSEKPITILYIDDEEHNLHSFKASFRKQYDITIASSVIDAELILEKQDFCIILADQRMPIMTGVQFFEKIRTKYPKPIRILITGHTDIGAAIDAINKGEVFRFIDKPWDYGYVENAISHAYDIYKTREDLKERNEELQKANEELDKFVYSASHDLRAPLMSVLGIVNLALLEDDIKSQNEYLELIRQSVKKLDTFIINIIDYYKNARGVPVVTDISFEELVTEVQATIQYLPEYGNLKMTTDIEQDGVFRSDVMKLRIIFNNLINNAIKFQDTNKQNQFVHLKIKSTPSSAKITIEDNGSGIKDSDQDKIFKMFYRAGATNSGSGIGLYIVHEAIAKLGGEISVSSKVGEGSIFEVNIPSIHK